MSEDIRFDLIPPHPAIKVIVLYKCSRCGEVVLQNWIDWHANKHFKEDKERDLNDGGKRSSNCVSENVQKLSSC